MLRLSPKEFNRQLCMLSMSVGIEINSAEADMHFKHAAALLEWNRRFNITAITNDEDIIIKHIIDSLMLSACLPLRGSIADIGSGGGFPGIALKIHNATLKATLVEANRKKANFLRHAIRSIGLKDISVYQGRVEAPGVPVGFDWIVSRAFAGIEALCACARPLIRKGGRLVYMQGSAVCADEKIEKQLGNTWHVVETHSYMLPRNKGRRHMLVLASEETMPGTPTPICE